MQLVHQPLLENAARSLPPTGSTPSPGSCFRRATSSPIEPMARREFCQSTFFSVLDNTSLGVQFIFSLATGSFPCHRLDAFPPRWPQPIRNTTLQLARSTTCFVEGSYSCRFPVVVRGAFEPFLVAYEMQGHLAPMRAEPMFPQVDALPSAERQAPA